jgi:hypothetical protein
MQTDFARQLQEEWEAAAATAALLARLEVADPGDTTADEALARRLQEEEDARVTPPACGAMADHDEDEALAQQLQREERLREEENARVTQPACAATVADYDEDEALAQQLQREEEELDQASTLASDEALAWELSEAVSPGSRKRPSQKQRRQEPDRSVGLAYANDSPEVAFWSEAGPSVGPAVPAWSPGSAIPAAVLEPPTGAMALAPRPSCCPIGPFCNQRSISGSSRAAALAAPGPKIVLVIDGANVAYNNSSCFRARSIRFCLEFWQRAGVRLDRMSVTLNPTHKDANDAELAAVEQAVYIMWTPSGKDDDLYTIQAAVETGAWVVTNDRFYNHARWTSRVGRRLIPFCFVNPDVFVAAPDDVEKFLRAVGIKT